MEMGAIGGVRVAEDSHSTGLGLPAAEAADVPDTLLSPSVRSRMPHSALCSAIVTVMFVSGSILVVVLKNGMATGAATTAASHVENIALTGGASKVFAQSIQQACPGDTRGHRGKVVCNQDATHRVCAKIGDANTSFWSFTGQRNWCNENLYPGTFCTASTSNSTEMCEIAPRLVLPCDGLHCSYVPPNVPGRSEIGCQPSCPTSDSSGLTVCGSGNDRSASGAANDGTWCICKWAAAEWIQGVWPVSVHSSELDCPQSIDINCAATDICNSASGLFFSYADFGVDLKPAHDCIKQKCASIWNACAAVNPSYIIPS